jgi:hypothetical protein
MTVKSVLAAAVLATTVAMGSTPASAVLAQINDVQLGVDYYNMNNGSGTGQFGDYQYWDGTYSGSGNKTMDNAPLTGGKGVLTNGFFANDRWDYYATANGTGQYVGWNTVYQSPSILFHLGGDTTVHSMNFYVDSSYVGLVGGPLSIVVNGVTYDSNSWVMTALTPNFGNAAGAYQITINGLNITSQDISVLMNPGPQGADALAWIAQYGPILDGNGQPYNNQPWLMLSEVQFNGVNAVPELSTWLMMLLGFAGVGFVAYRRQRTANPAAA